MRTEWLWEGGGIVGDDLPSSKVPDNIPGVACDALEGVDAAQEGRDDPQVLDEGLVQGEDQEEVL